MKYFLILKIKLKMIALTTLLYSGLLSYLLVFIIFIILFFFETDYKKGKCVCINFSSAFNDKNKIRETIIYYNLYGEEKNYLGISSNYKLYNNDHVIENFSHITNYAIVNKDYDCFYNIDDTSVIILNNPISNIIFFRNTIAILCAIFVVFVALFNLYMRKYDSENSFQLQQLRL